VYIIQRRLIPHRMLAFDISLALVQVYRIRGPLLTLVIVAYGQQLLRAQ